MASQDELSACVKEAIKGVVTEPNLEGSIVYQLASLSSCARDLTAEFCPHDDQTTHLDGCFDSYEAELNAEVIIEKQGCRLTKTLPGCAVACGSPGGVVRPITTETEMS